VNAQQTQAVAQTGGGVPDREEIRAALEAERRGFLELLDSLSDGDWRRKRPGGTWTVGELMTHVMLAQEYVIKELASGRKGKNFWKLPPYIFNPIRIGSARLSNRTVSRRAIRSRFDAASEAILAALDTVKDDEWQKGAYFYDEGYWTVERIFRLQPLHFIEHAEEIKKILGRD
jgi:hypothetical protein